MKFIPTLLAAASAAVFSSHSQAIVVVGTTLGGPIWNRPLAGTPPTGLSTTVTAVPYSVTPLTVSASGGYMFQSTATTFDNFTFLYAVAFSAATPLTNVLVGNDDNPAVGLSGFGYPLTAGTSYFFVTTGYSNADRGEWSLSITGPGDITVGVPEPETYGLMALGLAGVLVATRRRAAAAR